MAHYQVTAASLTPSRPAPAAPMRRDVGSALANSGYGSSFSVGTSSPAGSSYASSYTGIGGSPNRNSDMPNGSNIVRCGTVIVKEDGLVSFLWRPKWLVLKESTLSIHKNEVSRHPFWLRSSSETLRGDGRTSGSMGAKGSTRWGEGCKYGSLRHWKSTRRQILS